MFQKTSPDRMRKGGGWGIDEDEDDHDFHYAYDRADNGDGIMP